MAISVMCAVTKKADSRNLTTKPVRLPKMCGNTQSAKPSLATATEAIGNPEMVRRPAIKAAAAELPGARAAKLVAKPFQPQLAKLVDRPPSGDQWLHELKWDGYRLVVTMVGGKAALWSRNALPWSDKVPHIARALERLKVKDAALDGELIAGNGRQEDFNLLQAVLAGERKEALAFVLFDLLHVDGVSIEQAPLRERKALLARLLADPPSGLVYSSHVEGDAAQAFKVAQDQGFEGMISKRANRSYHSGRSDDWQKAKVINTDEFAVVGYTPSSGSKVGIGSLLLAKPARDGTWHYAGRVGTGFNSETVRELRRLIGSRGSTSPTIMIDPAKAKELTRVRSAKWFDPLFVIEANVRGMGGSGVLRQASYKGLRPDKTIGDLRDPDH
jgi:bifunctional non-homologous end joining protein LigD